MAPNVYPYHCIAVTTECLLRGVTLLRYANQQFPFTLVGWIYLYLHLFGIVRDVAKPRHGCKGNKYFLIKDGKSEK